MTGLLNVAAVTIHCEVDDDCTPFCACAEHECVCAPREQMLRFAPSQINKNYVANDVKRLN